ncbi:choice-of-anchor B family protein, partial [candidate division TA06 bacterium]|nr:choice-of-anchor B family protein [candidate division TA06 bacterium]
MKKIISFSASSSPVRQERESSVSLWFILFFIFHFSFVIVAKDGWSQGYNVNLLGQLPGNLQDCWGYVDTLTGKEYALICKNTALGIVDVSDPTNPVEVATYTNGSMGAAWAVKTYRNFALIGNQSNNVGLVIIDLSDPTSPTLVTNYTHPNVTSVHNLFVAGDYAYLASNTTDNVEILDISDPTNPLWVSSYDCGCGGFIHDMTVIDTLMYASFFFGGFYIVNVADPTNPQFLGFKDYPGSANHNSWPTEDGRYLLTTDETTGGHVRVWDIQNFLNIVEVGSYEVAPGRIVHNVYVRGDFAYIAYYGDGFRVLDITDPTNPIEVGYYDTQNAWGTYPFTPSGNIYVSDTNDGLFIFGFDTTYGGGIEGTVTDQVTTFSIEDAAVELVEAGKNFLTDSIGFYSSGIAAGPYTVIASAFGYIPDTSMATVTAGSTTIHDIALTPMPSGFLTGTVTEISTGDSLQGIIIEVTGTPLPTDITDAGGNYMFSTIPADFTYTVTA